MRRHEELRRRDFFRVQGERVASDSGGEAGVMRVDSSGDQKFNNNTWLFLFLASNRENGVVRVFTLHARLYIKPNAAFTEHKHWAGALLTG